MTYEDAKEFYANIAESIEKLYDCNITIAPKLCNPDDRFTGIPIKL